MKDKCCSQRRVCRRLGQGAYEHRVTCRMRSLLLSSRLASFRSDHIRVISQVHGRIYLVPRTARGRETNNDLIAHAALEYDHLPRTLLHRSLFLSRFIRHGRPCTRSVARTQQAGVLTLINSIFRGWPRVLPRYIFNVVRSWAGGLVIYCRRLSSGDLISSSS